MRKPRPLKFTTEQWIEKARARHGDRYDYGQVIYTGVHKKVRIVCREHGPFEQDPSNHVVSGSGCPTCSGTARLDTAEFIRRSKEVHGDRYDYSRAVFTTVDNKLTIGCSEHGYFEQRPYDHMKGRGCVECGKLKCVDARRHTLNDFLARARAKFGDAYDYSGFVYTTSLEKSTVICPEHGPFSHSPHEHIESTGCPRCAAGARVGFDDFVRRATEIHGSTYTYTAASFSTMHGRATAVCPSHGQFTITPKDHISKQAGCPQCAREATSSRGEKELAEWIASTGSEIVRNDRSTLGGFEIDIYLPNEKIGIEYHGAYWHRDVVMQHHRIHETKINRAESLGIRLITVWDFDWKAKPEIIKAHILHQMGHNNGAKVDARKCNVVTVDVKSASAFYNKHHIQGAAWRALAHYGLESNGALVACMSLSQGSSRRGRSGSSEWELLRFATAGVVRGGASRLFAHFIREHTPESVWSFSDRQHFSGGLYRQLGFVNDGHVAADYRVHHQASGRVWHKSAWQRKHIPTRLAEIGVDATFDPATDPRTEREMQDLAKCLRIMDAGKIRWKWA